MAKVGSLGNIVFLVSEKEIMTFSGFQHTAGAVYASHNRHLKSPLLEFTGVNSESLTFSVLLSSSLGVNPLEEHKKMLLAMKEGKALRLLLGAKQFGNYKWVITNIQFKARTISPRGGVLDADVTLTLSAYEKR